jgi:2-dehydropantoate 2-reductase
VGAGTAVLTLQNGLGNEAQLARLFSVAQILGGLCFVCLNRLEPGLIHHIAHGKVVLGEFDRPALPRTHNIAQMFRDGGVPCTVTDNLARAHWEKLVWNIPFNGLGVAAVAGYEALGTPASSPASLRSRLRAGGDAGAPRETLSTDKLLTDSRWESLVRELMLEVIAAARALGHEIPDALAEKQIGGTRDMGAYKASTLIDFERGLPLEMEGLFLEPLRQAQSAGVAVPRLTGLCEVLQGLDKMSNSQRGAKSFGQNH